MKKYKLIYLLFITFIYLNITEIKAENVRTIGDALQVMIPAYTFGLTMNEDGYEGAKQFTYSFITSQVTTNILKTLTKRKRPDYIYGKKKDSFPSGHTASAFLGASFIHKRYNFKQAIVPYILSAFVGYSRIHANRHHPSDVLGGAILAGLNVWIFTDKYKNIFVVPETKGVAIKYKTDF